MLNDGNQTGITTSLRATLHVTCEDFVKSILKDGLIPQVGLLSQEAGELPGIFMFPSWDAMTDANWLFNEAWPYDSGAALLCVDVTGLELDSDCDYEVVSRQPIHPSRITVLSPNDFDWSLGKPVFVAKGGRIEALNAEAV